MVGRIIQYLIEFSTIEIITQMQGRENITNICCIIILNSDRVSSISGHLSLLIVTLVIDAHDIFIRLFPVHDVNYSS